MQFGCWFGARPHESVSSCQRLTFLVVGVIHFYCVIARCPVAGLLGFVYVSSADDRPVYYPLYGMVCSYY